MSRRREKRKFLALPVRALGGADSSRQVVCTLDLSAHGARVIGLPQIEVGQEITLEHKNNRVRFQAVWVGQPGSSRQGQVGLRSLDPEKKLAEIDEFVAGAWVDQWSPGETATQGIQADRRAVQRFDCDRGVHYWSEEGGSLTAGQLENVSLNGCGIITKFPLPRRTRLGMIVSVYGMKIAAKGEVRVCEDGRMGVVFTMVDRENEARLKKAVQRLKQATSSERAPREQPELHDAEKILDEVRTWFDRNLTMSWEDFFDIQVRVKGSLVKATEVFDKFTS